MNKCLTINKRMYYGVLLVLFVSILFNSCNTVEESDNKSELPDITLTEYQSEKLQIVSIKTDSLETVQFGDDRAFRYCFKGELKNNSLNIFKSASIKMRINLLLDNGNIITNEDIDKAPLLADGTLEVISGQWLPNEIKSCKVFSPRIQCAYAYYPIQKVTINLILNAEDQINNEVTGGVFRTIDLTQTWRREAKKMIDRTTEYDLNLIQEKEERESRLKRMPEYILNN